MKDVTNVLYDFVLPSLSVGVGVTIKPQRACWKICTTYQSGWSLRFCVYIKNN